MSALIISDPLRDFAAYLSREADRRAKGSHPGVVRLRDEEIAALAALIHREKSRQFGDSKSDSRA